VSHTNVLAFVVTIQPWQVLFAIAQKAISQNLPGCVTGLTIEQVKRKARRLAKEMASKKGRKPAAQARLRSQPTEPQQQSSQQEQQQGASQPQQQSSQRKQQQPSRQEPPPLRTPLTKHRSQQPVPPQSFPAGGAALSAGQHQQPSTPTRDRSQAGASSVARATIGSEKTPLRQKIQELLAIVPGNKVGSVCGKFSSKSIDAMNGNLCHHLALYVKPQLSARADTGAFNCLVTDDPVINQPMLQGTVGAVVEELMLEQPYATQVRSSI